ncbi:hypothetical protein EC968_002897 [Mortierella alpina]|nr:hypothetical protein EC968_002897 [Mortierella alpina]
MVSTHILSYKSTRSVFQLKMKISVTAVAAAAVAVASCADAYRVCRSRGQNANTCAYECNNNDPADEKWCENAKKRLTSKGAECWGDCNSGNDFQFWCAKSSINPAGFAFECDD